MPNYDCSACHLGFSDIEGALKHLMTHNVLERRCLKPGCRSTKTHHLIRHTALKHSSLCHYQCQICPRRFVRQCDLKRHVTSRHDALNPSSALLQLQRTGTYEALLHNPFWSSYGFSSSVNASGYTIRDVNTLGTTNEFSLNRTTTSNALNEFISSKLQPDEDFNSTMSKTVDDVCSYFRKQMSPNQIIKGGSMGKGTAVKGKADIDLLLVLNEVHGADQLESVLPGMTEEIRENLRKSSHGTFIVKPGSISTTKFSVQFTVLSAANEEIKVDLLPTFLVDDKKSMYEQMKRGPRSLLPYYSAALAKLQIEFVSPMPANVKNLIRLVKNWRKEYIEEWETSERLPTSYVLELITIHLWEEKGKPRQFDTVKAFHSVMKTLADVDKLKVIWQENYSKTMIPADILREQPVVMDPANPFNNVCSTFGWRTVKSKAQEALRGSMLREVSSDNWM